MYSEQFLKNLITQVQRKRVSKAKALHRLKNLPYETFSFARVDHHRHFRKGFPEVIYSPGKTWRQLTKIIESLSRTRQPILITRVEEPVYKKLKRRYPALRYSHEGRVAYIKPPRSGLADARFLHEKGQTSKIAVVTAGTSDIPVAEEAAITLEIMGRSVERIYDCGVAGLHRLIDKLETIRSAQVIICVAGMEGALPSVLAGLIDRPVIAVPTSVGYGANFRGLAALLAMLNSCAQGVAVMNIDNGFGAACFASLATQSG